MYLAFLACTLTVVWRCTWDRSVLFGDCFLFDRSMFLFFWVSMHLLRLGGGVAWVYFLCSCLMHVLTYNMCMHTYASMYKLCCKNCIMHGFVCFVNSAFLCPHFVQSYACWRPKIPHFVNGLMLKLTLQQRLLSAHNHFTNWRDPWQAW